MDVNLKKNLAASLVASFQTFMKELQKVRNLTTKGQFCEAYTHLKEKYPQAISYLDKHFTTSVERWANYAIDTFTASVVSTQRGEVLNRRLNNHLDHRSSIKKVFHAINNRETWEHARELRQVGIDEVSFKDMGSIASVLFPDIYATCK